MSGIEAGSYPPAPPEWILLARNVSCRLFPGARLWLAILALVVSDVVWLLLSERLSADPLLLAQCGAAFILASSCSIWAEASHGRGRLHDMAMMALFCLAGLPALLIFNHLVMSLKMPLADDLLIAADRAVGFRWLAYAQFIASHAWLTAAMNLAYHGIHAAVAVCFVFHFASAQSRRAVEFTGLLLPQAS